MKGLLMQRAASGTMFLALVGALGCGNDGDERRKPVEVQATPASRVVDGMSPSGYRVEWGVPGLPCRLKAGSTVPVSVIVKNVGDQTWRDLPTADPQSGRGAVRLGYRWWSASNERVPAVAYAPVRGDLKAPVPPGGHATLTVAVVAPSSPGAYLLQLDLVDELIVWFENRGAAKLMVPVTVS